MKITPLEIRQKTFEKHFRGYDKDEVSGYLSSLSQEWEKLQDENKELKIKLQAAEKEVEKLREVENSLFKTLKTAEDTGANIMDQASKAAELHMKETELKSEALLNDARTKARDTIEESEAHAKEVYNELEGQVKSLSKLYQTLQNLRDDLLSDIRGLTTELNEKVIRAQKQVKDFDVDQHLMDIRKAAVSATSKKASIPKTEAILSQPEKNENMQEKKDEQKSSAPKMDKKEPVEVEDRSGENKNDTDDKSFFDEIG